MSHPFLDQTMLSNLQIKDVSILHIVRTFGLNNCIQLSVIIDYLKAIVDPIDSD